MMKSLLAMVAAVVVLAGCQGGYGHNRMDTNNPHPNASHPQGPDGKVHTPR